MAISDRHSNDRKPRFSNDFRGYNYAQNFNAICLTFLRQNRRSDQISRVGLRPNDKEERYFHEI